MHEAAMQHDPVMHYFRDTSVSSPSNSDKSLLLTFSTLGRESRSLAEEMAVGHRDRSV